VRIPDVIRECVCFLYVEEAGRSMRPVGTAFLVSYSSDDKPESIHAYLVTALHVIAGAKDAGHEFIYLRLNRPAGGGVDFAKTRIDGWVSAENPADAEDVAVHGAGGNLADEFQVRFIDHRMFATDELLRDYDIGTGDEVFLPGLFVSHAGTERNLPIVRRGSIAAMPEEPIATAVGALDAYLIEARSIGGLSGSPVFVNVGYVRMPKGLVMLRNDDFDADRPHCLLLGVIHGHFSVDARTELEPLTRERINMGIAIVVPISKVINLIETHPRFVAARK